MNIKIQECLGHAEGLLKSIDTGDTQNETGAFLIAIQDCIEAIKLLSKPQQQEHCMVAERIIHAWDRCDEYGWRCIYLFRQGEELMLFAYDKDGKEVPPNV